MGSSAQTIIVAIDNSNAARRALEVALRLAAANGEVQHRIANRVIDSAQVPVTVVQA